MKIKTITSLAIFFATNLNAQTPVPIQNIGNHPTVHNSGIPTVNNDGDDVNIRCDSTINNVNIIIKDQNGNIMHQSVQTISPIETTLSVQDDCESRKATIDLYYNRRHLYGVFDY